MSKFIKSIKKTQQTKIHLVCFHYAGGSANTFTCWIKYLNQHVGLQAIQLPGRGELRKDPFITDIHKIINMLTKEFTEICDLPYVFFGHSLGAILAYELAHELVSLGHKGPEHLIIAAAKSPAYWHDKELIAHLPDRELINKVSLFNDQILAVARDSDFLKEILLILRNDFALADNYRHQQKRKLICPITAFTGLMDPIVSIADMQKWQQETSTKFEIKLFPGKHIFISSSRELVVHNINAILNFLTY